MTETREILVRTPGATPNEQALVPLAGVKDFYARDEDPGAVGAGSVWKDTTFAPASVWWQRNAANDGWEAYAFINVEGVPDADATGGALATAHGTGLAASSITAQVDGVGASALAQANVTATVSSASATEDQTATANIVANALGDAAAFAGAQANSTAGPANAGAAASSDSGPAVSTSTSWTATGSATSGVSATQNVTEASLIVSVSAGGVRSFVLTGVPTSDPGVGNKLWSDSGVLKLTAPA